MIWCQYKFALFLIFAIINVWVAILIFWLVYSTSSFYVALWCFYRCILAFCPTICTLKYLFLGISGKWFLKESGEGCKETEGR